VFPLREAFGVKVCKIESTRHERNNKLELTNTVLDPIETFESEASPTAHSLSHKMTVGGCGYPRLPNTDLSSTAICPLAKQPAYSVSETAAVLTGIVVDWVCMGAFMKKGSVVPR
jgi:hypothetical protein